MTWIKICGMTNMEDGLNAASLGVDALGFIFAPSPRRIEPSAARRIIQKLPSSIMKVGVFLNQESSEVKSIADDCGLEILQFHGKETLAYCQRFSIPVIKAIRIKDFDSLKEMERYHSITFLLDTYHSDKAGGTGNPFPWEIALRAKGRGKIILSGGLKPSNVGEAVRKVRPWGVDVCSGVEIYPGKKDLTNTINFVKEVRKADEEAG